MLPHVEVGAEDPIQTVQHGHRSGPARVLVDADAVQLGLASGTARIELDRRGEAHRFLDRVVEKVGFQRLQDDPRAELHWDEVALAEATRD